jgi:hypothetical protein
MPQAPLSFAKKLFNFTSNSLFVKIESYKMGYCDCSCCDREGCSPSYVATISSSSSSCRESLCISKLPFLCKSSSSNRGQVSAVYSFSKSSRNTSKLSSTEGILLAVFGGIIFIAVTIYTIRRRLQKPTTNSVYAASNMEQTYPMNPPNMQQPYPSNYPMNQPNIQQPYPSSPNTEQPYPSNYPMNQPNMQQPYPSNYPMNQPNMQQPYPSSPNTEQPFPSNYPINQSYTQQAYPSSYPMNQAYMEQSPSPDYPMKQPNMEQSYPPNYDPNREQAYPPNYPINNSVYASNPSSSDDPMNRPTVVHVGNDVSTKN